MRFPSAVARKSARGDGAEPHRRAPYDAGVASPKSTRHRTARGRSGNPAKAPEVAVRPATFRDWVGAARLRTLPLAISPVIIGTGAAHLVDGLFHWLLALGCLAVAVFLQIGVNYAND